MGFNEVFKKNNFIFAETKTKSNENLKAKGWHIWLHKEK